ncbi:MAG: hypothetical protein JNK05_20715 [Myxococcales bacterium]|nr:hypothetical protein [Myxococcales bacterium]
MNHRIVRTLVLSSAVAAWIGTAANHARADRVSSAPIVVDATLVEAGPAIPACGILHSIGVARFEQRRARVASVSNPVFWVAFSCRAMSPRDVGRVFELQLTTSRPWPSRAIFWPQGRPRAPLYFATRPPRAL